MNQQMLNIDVAFSDSLKKEIQKKATETGMAMIESNLKTILRNYFGGNDIYDPQHTMRPGYAILDSFVTDIVLSDDFKEKVHAYATKHVDAAVEEAVKMALKHHSRKAAFKALEEHFARKE